MAVLESLMVAQLKAFAKAVPGTASKQDAFPPPHHAGHYIWEGHRFSAVVGIQMTYQGASQIQGWDPNQVMASITETGPNNQVLRKRRVQLKQISDTPPPNNDYQAITIMSGPITGDVRGQCIGFEVITETVISVLPGGILLFAGFARIAVDDQAPWSAAYYPPNPPSSIPLQGWREEYILGDYHVMRPKRG